ncbi:MAG: glycosyltransferase involved in cell wall biosynthesis [Planctomycetota bacterium]
MRILTVLPKLPGDPVDGHVIRTRPLLRRLVQQAEVDILAYDVGSIDEDIAAGAASCKVVPAHLDRNTSLAFRLRKFFSPDDVQQRDAEFSEALKDVLRRSDHDLVWVAGWRMLLYLPEVRQHMSTNSKIVADVVDDDIRRDWQDLRDARGLIGNVTMARRLFRNVLYQRKFLAEADLALFVAEGDAKTTRKRIPGLRVEVNQNGVDTDYFAPAAEDGRRAGDRPVLLFEGTMSYQPNIEGATHLVRYILPIVQRSIPEASVLIVGRNPTPEIQALAAEDVEVTGTVDDIREHMSRGSLLACSLRTGTGLKNKILQSWAMGIPVVATPISVPGLGGVHEGNMLIADGAERFAEQCVRLLKSPELSRDLSQAGRAFALERYSIHVKLHEIDGFINELLDHQRMAPLSARAQTAAK